MSTETRLEYVGNLCWVNGVPVSTAPLLARPCFAAAMPLTHPLRPTCAQTWTPLGDAAPQTAVHVETPRLSVGAAPLATHASSTSARSVLAGADAPDPWGARGGCGSDDDGYSPPPTVGDLGAPNPRRGRQRSSSLASRPKARRSSVLLHGAANRRRPCADDGASGMGTGGRDGGIGASGGGGGGVGKAVAVRKAAVAAALDREEEEELAHARRKQRRRRHALRQRREAHAAAADSLRKLRVLRQVITSQPFAHAVLRERRSAPGALTLSVPVVCRRLAGADGAEWAPSVMQSGVFVACGRPCEWADGVAARVMAGECEVFPVRLTTPVGARELAKRQLRKPAAPGRPKATVQLLREDQPQGERGLQPQPRQPKAVGASQSGIEVVRNRARRAFSEDLALEFVPPMPSVPSLPAAGDASSQDASGGPSYTSSGRAAPVLLSIKIAPPVGLTRAVSLPPPVWSDAEALPKRVNATVAAFPASTTAAATVGSAGPATAHDGASRAAKAAATCSVFAAAGGVAASGGDGSGGGGSSNNRPALSLNIDSESGSAPAPEDEALLRPSKSAWRPPSLRGRSAAAEDALLKPSKGAWRPPSLRGMGVGAPFDDDEDEASVPSGNARKKPDDDEIIKPSAGAWRPPSLRGRGSSGGGSGSGSSSGSGGSDLGRDDETLLKPSPGAWRPPSARNRTTTSTGGNCGDEDDHLAPVSEGGEDAWAARRRRSGSCSSGGGGGAAGAAQPAVLRNRARSNSLLDYASSASAGGQYEPISARLTHGACGRQGPRSHMEDEHVGLADLERFVCSLWNRRGKRGDRLHDATPADEDDDSGVKGWWRPLCSRPGSAQADPFNIVTVAVDPIRLPAPVSPDADEEEDAAWADSEEWGDSIPDAAVEDSTAASSKDEDADLPSWLRRLRQRCGLALLTELGMDVEPLTPKSTQRHSFFGVFDGHAGRAAVEYVAARLPIAVCMSQHFPRAPKKALREAFLETDAELLRLCKCHEWDSGTTAAVLLLSGDVLITAHAGDSRIVLATSRPGVQEGGFMELTADHKPNDEKEKSRIERAGGNIVKSCEGSDVWCVTDRHGYEWLSVARSFGDWDGDLNRKVRGQGAGTAVAVFATAATAAWRRCTFLFAC